MAQAPLDQVIDPGWAQALAPVEPELRALGQMVRDEQAQGRRILPAGSNILRAFTYPFSEVKVLLVGQDPYPTIGNSIGLAFAVDHGVRIPASLRNIYRELQDDLDCPPATHGDLSSWAAQGVCLLNRVLTVEAGRPASHQGRGWEKVTDQAIKSLVERGSPLVTILWGRQAGAVKSLLGGTPWIESAHPSPLSAHRGFFGSRPFSTVNRFLQEQGAEPVRWCLP